MVAAQMTSAAASCCGPRRQLWRRGAHARCISAWCWARYQQRSAYIIVARARAQRRVCNAFHPPQQREVALILS